MIDAESSAARWCRVRTVHIMMREWWDYLMVIVDWKCCDCVSSAFSFMFLPFFLWKPQTLEASSNLWNIDTVLIFRSQTRDNGFDRIRDGVVDAIFSYVKESAVGTRKAGPKDCWCNTKQSKKQDGWWWDGRQWTSRSSCQQIPAAILASLLWKIVYIPFGKFNLTPSPTLKLRTFPFPPNWSTTSTTYLSSFCPSLPKSQ